MAVGLVPHRVLRGPDPVHDGARENSAGLQGSLRGSLVADDGGRINHPLLLVPETESWRRTRPYYSHDYDFWRASKYCNYNRAS